MSEIKILPITVTEQAQVRTATQDRIHIASKHYQQDFATIPVHFDLQGRSAGQFRAQGTLLARNYLIRYNPWVFSLDFPHHLADTVAHEVAHYITYLRHPQAKPHGKEWKSLMRLFGATPMACSPYNIDGIAVRVQRRHDYVCNCKDRRHAITTTRHNRIFQGHNYICRNCNGLLRPSQTTLD